MKAVKILAGSLLAVSSCLGVPTAEAQQLSVALHSGRVTLSAEDVPLHSIVVEWARIGGSVVTNLGAVSRDLVSLEFMNVSEAEMLDTLLRDTQGYVLVARTDAGDGRSLFEHLVILPPGAIAARPTSTLQQSPQALTPSAEDLVPRRAPARNVSRFPPDDELVNQLPEGESPPAPAETPVTNRPGFPGGGAGIPIGGLTRPGEISPVPDDARDR